MYDDIPIEIRTFLAAPKSINPIYPIYPDGPPEPDEADEPLDPDDLIYADELFFPEELEEPFDPDEPLDPPTPLKDYVEAKLAIPKLLFSEGDMLLLLGITRHRLIKNVKSGIYPAPRRIGAKKAAWTYTDLKKARLINDPETDVLDPFYTEIAVKEIDVCVILDVARATLRTNPVFPKPDNQLNWIYANLVAFVESLPKVIWRDMTIS